MYPFGMPIPVKMPILVEFGSGLLDCSGLRSVKPDGEKTLLVMAYDNGGGMSYTIDEPYVDVLRKLERAHLYLRPEKPRLESGETVALLNKLSYRKSLERDAEGVVTAWIGGDRDSVFEVDFGGEHGLVAVHSNNLRTVIKIEEPVPAA